MTKIEESLHKIFQDHLVVFWYGNQEEIYAYCEGERLYPLAAERNTTDLDDGVLVTYNMFGKALQEVKDLNDKKRKVRELIGLI